MYNENFNPNFENNNQVQEGSNKRKMKGVKAKIRNAAAGGVVFGLSAGLVFTGVSKINSVVNPSKVSSTVQMSTTKDALSTSYSDKDNNSADTYSVQDIAAKCKSSVVSITSTSVESVQDFFGGARQYESSSAGSGIVVAKDDENLYIATNNHVVQDAKDVSVCFNDSEEQVYEAQIKGTDTANDLAIAAVSLKDIPEDVLNSISIATLGDSDSVEIGEQVVAIGNALGYGQSVTSGYISALDREVEIDGVTASLIQTDAAINPGNSGGALFNMKGEVIGINSAKFSSEEVEGMGYAIPVSVAEPILEQLMTMDKVEEGQQGSLGISCEDVSSEVSDMYDIPQGVYVDDVENGGAADEAGIEKGDIITEFDGKAVTDTSTLKNTIQYYKKGDSVEVTLQRRSDKGYEEKTVKVTLGAAQEQSYSDKDSHSDSNYEDNESGNIFG